MKNAIRTVLSAATVAASFAVLAQDGGAPARSAAEAQKAVDARIEHFKLIKKTYEPLTDMLKNKREFDAALIESGAKQLQVQAGQIPAMYKVDTRGFKDIKTEARDAVWIAAADFKVRADAMGKAAGSLAAIAPGGDKGATRKAIAELGKTCGACHDNYKAEN